MLYKLTFSYRLFWWTSYTHPSHLYTSSVKQQYPHPTFTFSPSFSIFPLPQI
jgi:hypothetical protein